MCFSPTTIKKHLETLFSGVKKVYAHESPACTFSEFQRKLEIVKIISDKNFGAHKQILSLDFCYEINCIILKSEIFNRHFRDSM